MVFQIEGGMSALRRIFAVMLGVAVVMLCMGTVDAASGEYLQYQEPKPTAFSSWFSTLAYIVSLLLTFAAVLAMAYFASRFLGLRMAGGGVGWSKLKGNRVLQTIPLGQNKAVSIVDAAGKILVLGVTDNNVALLTEIVDLKEIEKLKLEAEKRQDETDQFEQVLQRQVQSLQQMTNRFPKVFSRQQQRQQEQDKNHGE